MKVKCTKEENDQKAKQIWLAFLTGSWRYVISTWIWLYIVIAFSFVCYLGCCIPLIVKGCSRKKDSSDKIKVSESGIDKKFDKRAEFNPKIKIKEVQLSV